MSQNALQVAVDEPSEQTHRFGDISFRGVPWDLSHLDSFTFKIDLGLGTDTTVLVLFSCHCFTHSLRWDKRPQGLIPAREIYDDGKEQRVLDDQRYELSRRFLRDVVMTMPSRRIVLADDRQPNFVTVESVNTDGTRSLYAIFFEVRKDKSRKHRMVLRIQSAYLLDDGLTKRQTSARRIGFATLLRATYLGKKIRA
ncbi:MAG TPA: hypothetical protein VGN31_07615 [Paraburkholderia sp.]|jgi:hypothetical protein